MTDASTLGRQGDISDDKFFKKRNDSDATQFSLLYPRIPAHGMRLLTILNGSLDSTVAWATGWILFEILVLVGIIFLGITSFKLTSDQMRSEAGRFFFTVLCEPDAYPPGTRRSDIPSHIKSPYRGSPAVLCIGHRRVFSTGPRTAICQHLSPSQLICRAFVDIQAAPFGRYAAQTALAVSMSFVEFLSSIAKLRLKSITV